MILIVEWLPSYKTYRVWNNDYEGVFTNKKKMIKCLQKYKYTSTFVTYGTARLIKDFKMNGLILEKER